MAGRIWSCWPSPAVARPCPRVQRAASRRKLGERWLASAGGTDDEGRLDQIEGHVMSLQLSRQASSEGTEPRPASRDPEVARLWKTARGGKTDYSAAITAWRRQR
jgi:hypothetical protein